MATNDPFSTQKPTDDQDYRFEDPFPGRKSSYRPRGKGMTSKRAPKDQKPEDKLTKDRLDLDMLAKIALNPTEFLRQRYQQMLAKEQEIIDKLYSEDPIDDKALTAALKRITDIGDSLKALPKQSTETAANQKSLAEVIADCLKDNPEWGALLDGEEDDLNTQQLERADAAFGEGS